jgi:hypothetical protein
MTVKQLGNLLNSNGNGDLGDLVRRARDMGELTETLSRALPAELAASLIAANIREDRELVVICRSSAWASRLRFEEASLLAAARAHGASVDKVSVRVTRVDYNSGE